MDGIGWWGWPDADVWYTINFQNLEDTDSDTENEVAVSMPSVQANAYAAYSIVVPSDYGRPNYNLTGWKTRIGGETVVLAPEGSIPARAFEPGDVVTLIAQWEKIRRYSITYDPNAAVYSGSMGDESDLPADAPHTIRANNFKRFGYEMKHWEVLVNGELQPYTYAPGAVIPADRYDDGDLVTLRACWEPTSESRPLEDGELSFTLKGGEMALIENIPAGAVYEIYEETPAGWVLYKSNWYGTITSLDQAESTFYNVYRAGETRAYLTAQKTLDDVGKDGYDFELVLVSEDGVEKNELIDTVKSGDGGMITFKQLIYTKPGTYRYRIKEIPGTEKGITYVEDPVFAEVVVEDDNVGNYSRTITYYDKDNNPIVGPVIFNNTTNPGSLSIKKIVNEGAPTDEFFTLRIRFFDKDGVPKPDFTPGCATKTLDPTDANGYVEVSIGAGETITLVDIPAGMSYEIEETDLPSSFWELTDFSGLSGKIEASEESEARLTNTYTYRASGSVSLEARKWFDGGELTSNMFGFELVEVDEFGNELPDGLRYTAKNGAPDTMLVYDEATGEMVPGENYGSAMVVFDWIPYTEEGTHYYIIRELIPDNDDSINYDAEPVFVTVTVRDKGDRTGTLIATPKYSKGGANESVFHNSPTPGENFLRVDKTLVNATAKAAEIGQFTFSVDIWDSKASKDAGKDRQPGPFTVKKSNGEELVITAEDNTVTIKGGEHFIVEGLPEGAYYQVNEIQPEPGNGFTLDSVPADAEGEIELDYTAVTFTNVYESSGEFTFRARKSVAGLDALPENREFKFNLWDANGNLLSTGVAGADGEVVFEIDPPLVFTDEDDGATYRYRITEVVDEADTEYRYDTHSETIFLTVNDNGDGTLSFTPSYAEDQGQLPEFVNTPRGQLRSLRITKKVAGSMGDYTQSFDFDLRLWDSNGNPITDVLTCVKDGEDCTWTPTDTGRYKFSLSHDEYIEFQGLPVGSKYTIEEARFGDYVISVEGGTLTDGTVTGTLEDNVEVGFTNTLNGVVPTGVSAEARWLASMMLMSCCGMAWLLNRRRRRT